MNEVVTVHDKIRSEMLKKTKAEWPHLHIPEIKEYKSNLNDLDEIKTALTYILEKLTSLDRYVRGHRMGAKVNGKNEVPGDYLIDKK